MSAVDAALIGAIAGLVCVWCEVALLRLKIDDAVGAVPVHLGCGIWGTLAVAFFGDPEMLGTGLGTIAQLAVQIQGVAAAFAIAFAMPFILIRTLNRWRPMRVTCEAEKSGLNVSEHGVSTELHDLFDAMDRQVQTGDLSIRVPVEPFTEVGQIAQRYNHVMHVLEQTSSKIEAIFRSASDAIITFTTDNYLISQVNPSAWRMFGFSGQAAMINRPVTDLFDIGGEDTHKSFFGRLFSHRVVEVNAKGNQGRTFPVEGIVTKTRTGKEQFYIGTFRDISVRKTVQANLEHQQLLFKELFTSSPLGIIIVDPDGTVMDANQSFTALFGHSSDAICGKQYHSLLIPAHLMEEATAMFKTVMKGQTIQRETLRLDEHRRPIHVSILVYPITVKNVIMGAYYIYSDISQRKEYENQLTHQAFHDALTGLPNRILFSERLQSALRRQSRNRNHAFAAMMLDMDRFKKINDTLGHQAGDAFLMEVARRLKACFRSADTVSRLGGDEFGIIVEDYLHPREVVTVAKRIIRHLADPFIIAGQEIRSSASIGIVIKAQDHIDAESIMRDADIAMYRAKEFGTGRFKVFTEKMRSRVVRESELEQELHIALQNCELAVYYQPIVTVENESLMGFEALVRWDNPRCGMISPAEFIPVAEDTGQIVAIGRYVLKTACEQMARWRASSSTHRYLTISVNVSAGQFRHAELVRFVAETLSETGLPAECLKLELTESALMKDVKASVKIMEDLKRMGVQIVVDDFGTGYSSLSYIQRFPIDGLKIDRSFISGDSHWNNSRIVQTIISLARIIGVGVVAEGVEDRAQLDMLRKFECEFAQGYLFSKPLPEKDASALLHCDPLTLAWRPLA